MNKEELEWLLDIATTTGISYSGDKTITIDFANKVINHINKQKEVLNKIKEKVNQYELIKGYYDYIEENGYVETTSHDTLKEDILELLEEIK